MKDDNCYPINFEIISFKGSFYGAEELLRKKIKNKLLKVRTYF